MGELTSFRAMIKFLCVIYSVLPIVFGFRCYNLCASVNLHGVAAESV